MNITMWGTLCGVVFTIIGAGLEMLFGPDTGGYTIGFILICAMLSMLALVGISLCCRDPKVSLRKWILLNGIFLLGALIGAIGTPIVSWSLPIYRGADEGFWEGIRPE